MEADRERAKRYPLILAQGIEKRSPEVQREGRNPPSFCLPFLYLLCPGNLVAKAIATEAGKQQEPKAVSEGDVLPIL